MTLGQFVLMFASAAIIAWGYFEMNRASSGASRQWARFWKTEFETDRARYEQQRANVAPYQEAGRRALDELLESPALSDLRSTTEPVS